MTIAMLLKNTIKAAKLREKRNKIDVKKLYNWSSSWTGTIVIVLGIIFLLLKLL